MDDFSPIDDARDLGDLVAAAASMRRALRGGAAPGEPAAATTGRITAISDRVTTWLFDKGAAEAGLDPDRACWLAFGSQGRREQTLATDQDNGLVLDPRAGEAERTAWRALGEQVNDALAACGYALCQGRVMAGQPACCLTLDQWCDRFDHWMEHGAPEDLLNAAIYFDLRPVAGRLEFGRAMRERITGSARGLPRFVKQMADNALRNAVPLGWFGGIRVTKVAGRSMLDLKLHGSALYVEAARVYALALGVEATGTAERLDAAASTLHVPADERRAWLQGFERLQRLRLKLHTGDEEAGSNPNLIGLDRLDHADLAELKKGLRAARVLQQRIELDYRR